jgi:1-acyl-sn-glycerol-3-phosphate acyltransferase
MGNALTRFLGRSVLKLLGWRVSGELPPEKHMIVMVAPHTSNWDFITAMAALTGAGVKWSYLMKREAFFFPFKTLFMALGGVPVDRSQKTGFVEQAAEEFQRRDKFWLALTPEGTRSKVPEYKTGFLRIAQLAEVPVFVVAWNYPTKEIVLDKIWATTDNIDNDARDIRDYINQHYTGRYPELQ